MKKPIDTVVTRVVPRKLVKHVDQFLNTYHEDTWWERTGNSYESSIKLSDQIHAYVYGWMSNERM